MPKTYKTYNGRFEIPKKSSKGTIWMIGGFAWAGLSAIGLSEMSQPDDLAPILVLTAISAVHFLLVARQHKKRARFERFREYAALIGNRTVISLNELRSVYTRNEKTVRKDIKKMILDGWFGKDAYFDASADALVLPLPQGQGDNWAAVAAELLRELRNAAHKEEDGANARQENQNTQRHHADVHQSVHQNNANRGETPKRQTAEKKKDTCNVSYADRLEQTLNKLYDLNLKIEDEGVSTRIDRIGTLTADIFRTVINNPNREPDVAKFMNYYLPTTLKLLNSYDMLEDQKYQSENIKDVRRRIEGILDTLIGAYEQMLDHLYRDDALDIASDIDVLETMMAGDGLSEKNRLRMPK